MKKLLTSTVMAASLSALALTGCTSTTSTGAVGVDRQQLLLVSSEQVLQLSAQSYAKTLQEAKARGVLDTNKAQLNRLKNIANRLVGQVGVYRPDAAKWQWEVHTIKSNELNAFVVPGGKIMFYSGIIDRLNLTDDGLRLLWVMRCHMRCVSIHVSAYRVSMRRRLVSAWLLASLDCHKVRLSLPTSLVIWD